MRGGADHLGTPQGFEGIGSRSHSLWCRRRSGEREGVTSVSADGGVKDLNNPQSGSMMVVAGRTRPPGAPSVRRLEHR